MDHIADLLLGPSKKAVQFLLQGNVDVNLRDQNWQSPLHVCCIYDSYECAALLCPKVANIDATDKQGRSALAYASFNGNSRVHGPIYLNYSTRFNSLLVLKMVKLLLDYRANCNIKDKLERRPIHWASYMGYTDVVVLLRNHGADINCLDREVKY